MTIPTSSLYPEEFDTEDNLYVVHDGLRLRLSETYTPGDTTIYVESNPDMMEKFPSTGLITLTEQVSDIEDRAISFYYASKTDTSFSGLELLDGFTDSIKPEKITNVTQNVMAEHHNNLKNALIAIETFIGTKGTIDTVPFGPTMTGRINFLRKLVLTPRAWFKADKHTGLIPLEVTFTNQSFRLGDGEVTYLWDFGDQTTSYISIISVTSYIPTSSIEVYVRDLDGGEIQKTYLTPGIYDVKLTVTNDYGEDTVEFQDFITAKIQAPIEAEMDFSPLSTQDSTLGDQTPLFDRLATNPAGPWTTYPPTIRAVAGSFVHAQVPEGENPLTPGYSYAGEELDDSGDPIDSVATFTWSFSDDLIHTNNREAEAMYSSGGIYDMVLRVDTSFGAYRITTYENVVDIIEQRNLWLFNNDSSTLKAHEFGLISETFKTATRTHSITSNDGFLDDTGDETRAKREFFKNAFFTNTSTASSGNGGDSLLLWPSGGSSGSLLSTQTIESVIYNAFVDTYTASSLSVTRPWNFIAFNAETAIYLLFGPDPNPIPNINLSNQVMSEIDPTDFSVTATTLSSSNYTNGAEELEEHITGDYELDGEPNSGRFAVYRTAWKDSKGYIVRNSNVLSLFRLSSFYRTEGILTTPIQIITKLMDMPGSTKVEGELVAMANGLFFFNNSGNVAAYNDASGVWEVGSSNTTSFRSLQDSTVTGFDSTENTLLAASDGDRMAYLSYDYSDNAVIKFNGLDLTFSKLSERPTGTQWVMGVY